MSLRLKTILITTIIAFMIFVYLRLRSNKISTKYSLIWFSVSFIMIFATLKHDLMEKIANFLGIEVASNFIFLIIIGILLIIIFFMSSAVSKLNDKTTALAQEVAILKNNSKEK